MKTIAKLSEESLKLINYIQEFLPGQYLSYEQIQKDTGVEMNIRGKAYLRTALKKLKKEYSCVIGKGIELASANSALPIITRKLIKVDNAVRQSEKSYNNITNDFYHELEEDEKKQIHFLGAAFGAIRLAAENGKKYIKYSKNMKLLTPILPDNIEK